MKTRNRRFLNYIILAAGALTALLQPAFADSHTWAGVGISGNWSLPANWAANNPPSAGEAAPVLLFFPSGASRLTNTNNVAGLVVDGMSVTGNGYTLHGSGTGTNITFHNNGLNTFFVSSTGNTLASTLNITLSGAVVFNVSGSLTNSAKLLGSGGIVKNNPGSLTLNELPDNTFAGGVTVNEGTLYLAAGFPFFSGWIGSVAIPGPLTIGNPSPSIHPSVVLLEPDQIADSATVTLGHNGTLNLNNHSDMCGSLTFDGGTAQSGSGTLTLNGNITTTTNGGTIYDNLSLGGATRQFSGAGYLAIYAQVSDGVAAAGITKNGTGTLQLLNSNSFTGPTTINAGYVIAYYNSALGAGSAGVTVNAGGQLKLSSYDPTFFSGGPAIIVANKTLSIAGTGPNNDGALFNFSTNEWSGPIVLPVAGLTTSVRQDWPFDKLTFSGPISGPGSLWLNGKGNFVITGSLNNTFTGWMSTSGTNTTWLAKTSGATAVPGTLYIGDDFQAVGSSVVRLGAANQIANNSSVNFFGSGWLDLATYNETVGPITFSGAGEFWTGGGNIVGSGTLTITDNVTNNGDAWGNIYCPLSLGGQTRTFNTLQAGLGISVYGNISDGGGSAGIVKDGPWDLWLYGSNTYSGTTTIKWGEVSVRNSQALGSTAGGTVVQEYGTLRLEGFQVSGELLTCSNLDPYAVSYIGTNSWSGPVTLANNTYIASSVVPPQNGLDQLTISGPISGPGSLEMDGAGAIILTGATPNSFAGKTSVRGGQLILGKPAGTIAVPGNLEIGKDDEYYGGQVVLNSDNQISPGPVGYAQVNNTGTLDLNNHNQSLPSLILNDNAYVTTGSGLLTMLGNISLGLVSGGYADVEGRLSLGGADRVIATSGIFSLLYLYANVSDGGASAGMKINGGGTVEMGGSNSFSGVVTVEHAILRPVKSYALGATTSGVIVTNLGLLDLFGVNITNESLTISGPGYFGDYALYVVNTNIWTGPVQLAGGTEMSMQFTDSMFSISGPVTGAGNLIVEGAGTFRFNGTAPNTATGTLTAAVNLFELAKTGATAVGGPVELTGGTFRLRASHQIIDTASLHITTAATFDLNGYSETVGDFFGNGSANLIGGILTVGGANSVNTFSGIITGVGGELDKIGGNTLVLSGNNSYNAGTLVKGGTLLVNGSQPASDVYVYSSATIGGTGTIGNLYGNGGTVSPGNSPGKLNCGNVTFNTNTTLFVELNGTNVGTTYDQLNVTGTVILNASVTLKVSKHFAGAVGDQFVIVNNDFADFGLGTFAGLPEGSTFTADGTQFSITYKGGSPINDIVLTQLTVPAAPQIGGITLLGNGDIQLTGTGIPNLTYFVQANTNLSTTNWINLGSVTADNLGAIAFTDAAAKNFPQRFYRLLLP